MSRQPDLTPQRNHPGLWCSEVIAERWQIMESQLSRGRYYIYDLVQDDLMRQRDRSCRYFDSRAAARAEIQPKPAKQSKTRPRHSSS